MESHIQQKWHVMLNGQPFNFPEVSVRLRRLTPEEIKMHTRSSKKRAAETFKYSVDRGKNTLPPPSKKFKRIVLPHDNSDDEEDSRALRTDAGISFERRNARSVSCDSEGVKHVTGKVVLSRRNTCPEASQHLNKLQGQLKENTVNRVLTETNLSCGQSHEPSSSSKILAKIQSNKESGNRLSEPDRLKKKHLKFSEENCQSKGQSVTKLKGKRESNCTPVLVSPSRVTNKAEDRHHSAIKHPPVKEPLMQFFNSKEEKKSASKVATTNSHGNKVDEKMQKAARIDEKSKFPNIANEKLENLPKLAEKSGNPCKVNEKPQREEAILTIPESELKWKDANQVSLIVAENIDDLMNEYEQLTTTVPIILKTTGEKRNDKKPSQKKMLNMFGEEHLVEDSQSIYRDPFISPTTNKEKAIFLDLTSTLCQGDDGKIQDKLHPENLAKLKSSKVNSETDFTELKDLSNVKEKDVKKRKLSEPMHKKRTEKLRRHSMDTVVEKSNKSSSTMSSAKNDQTNYQKKGHSGFANDLNASKHPSVNKYMDSYIQICAGGVAVDRTNRNSDLGNENTDREQTSRVKENEIVVEKCKKLENEGKKTREMKKFKDRNGTGISVKDPKAPNKSDDLSEGKKSHSGSVKLIQIHREKSESNKVIHLRRHKPHSSEEGCVSLRKNEKEKSVEIKKIHSLVGESMSPKNKGQVSSSKLEKTKVTSKEVKVISLEVCQHQGTCESDKAKDKLSDIREINLAEKENVESLESEPDIVWLHNAISKSINEPSSSTVNSSFNNCNVERRSQIKKSPTTISPLKIINGASSTGNSPDSNMRSPIYSPLNEQTIDIQSNKSFIGEKQKTDDISSEKLKKLELEYENQEKLVGEHSAKKYLLWQQIEKLHGIQVIKEEVPDDDDDCQIITSFEDTFMVKEENDKSSSIATEVMDWSDHSTTEQQDEILDDCDTCSLDNSPLIAVEESVGIQQQNDEVLTGHKASRLVDSSIAEVSTDEQKSGRSVDIHHTNKGIDDSVVTTGDTSNGKQKCTEVSDCHVLKMLISSSVIEDSSCVQKNSSNEVVNGCNIDSVDHSSVVTTQDSTHAQQKNNGLLDFDDSTSVKEKGSCDAVGSHNAGDLVPMKHPCGEDRLQVCGTVIAEEENMSEQVSENRPSDCPEMAPKESEVEGAFGVCSPRNSDSGNSVGVREERIRVRGIEDLIEQPSNGVTLASQESVLAEEDGYLRNSFSPRESVNLFKDLVNVMVIIAKEAEAYIVSNLDGKSPAISSTEKLRHLINQHCILIYRLCKKVFGSFKERPECFLSFLFMQMVTRWQGYWGKFTVKHLKILLRSSFYGVIRFVSTANRSAFEREAKDLLIKMNAHRVRENQELSLVATGSEIPNVRGSSHNANVNNIMVSNKQTNVQLHSLPPTVNYVAANTQKNPAAAPNSTCHIYIDRNMPVRGEQIYPEVGNRNATVGQIQSQPEISSTTNSVQLHHTQSNLKSKSYVNSQTHGAGSNGNASALNAKPGSYRLPSNYFSVVNACPITGQQSLVGQVTQNQGVIVAQQKTSHLQRLIEMSDHAQQRNGSQSASQMFLSSRHNVQNVPSILSQHLLKHGTNATMQQAVPPLTNSSQQPAPTLINNNPQHPIPTLMNNNPQHPIPTLSNNNPQHPIPLINNNPQHTIPTLMNHNPQHPVSTLINHNPQHPISTLINHNPQHPVPTLASNSQQPVPALTNNSQQVISGQYQVHIGNYQVNPNLRPSFHASPSHSSASQVHMANERQSVHRSSSLESHSRLYPLSQRPLNPASLMQDSNSANQHHLNQSISFNSSSLRVSSSTFQQHTPSQRHLLEISSRESTSVLQQHINSAVENSLREPASMQQHIPSQRPSFGSSSVRELQPFDRPSLMEPSSTQQQPTPSHRPSYSSLSVRELCPANQKRLVSSSLETNSAGQHQSPNQRSSFSASALREPMSTHQLQHQNQVPVSRSSNSVANVVEFEKQTPHQSSVDQLHHYNCSGSNLHSSMRNISQWSRHVVANGGEMSPNSSNNLSEALPQINNASEAMARWHVQDQQFSHQHSLDATIRVGQKTNDYQNANAQSDVTQTSPSQHRSYENVIGMLCPHIEKSCDHLNYRGPAVQQHKIEQHQNGLRPTIIHTTPQRTDVSQKPSEHILPVLDQSYSSQQPDLQRAFLSSTIYTSNLQNTNEVDSHVYNNPRTNYISKLGVGSCSQSLLPSLPSPVHDNSPGLLLEENDQVRGQGVSRSISRDSGYRSPSQATDTFARSCGKCFVCHKEAILTCSRCKSVFYCNTDCQMGDWSRHKMECKTSS